MIISITVILPFILRLFKFIAIFKDQLLEIVLLFLVWVGTFLDLVKPNLMLFSIENSYLNVGVSYLGIFFITSN